MNVFFLLFTNKRFREKNNPQPNRTGISWKNRESWTPEQKQKYFQKVFENIHQYLTAWGKKHNIKPVITSTSVELHSAARTLFVIFSVYPTDVPFLLAMFQEVVGSLQTDNSSSTIPLYECVLTHH